jgi:hypothetical protein
LLTLNTSAVAVCLAKASVNSAFRRQFREQAHILDGDDRLVSERPEQFDLGIRESSGPLRMTPIVPIGLRSRSIGTLRMPRQPPATARSLHTPDPSADPRY